MATASLRVRLAGLLAAVLLLMAGFGAGFLTCLKDAHATGAHAQLHAAAPEGNAPLAVRGGVVTALQAFQDGYARRDPRRAEPFVRSLFAGDADMLVLGTDESEWGRGFPAVVDFVRSDWERWGDVRINTEGPIINASQDVAWVATAGEVRFGDAARPIRLSAVLTREGETWRFRQVQFQWDDRDPSASDLLRAETYLTAMRAALHKLEPRRQASPAPAAGAH